VLTYALDPTTWDLTLDLNGNFATVADQAQIAQDVASAIRTFAGECWYDTRQGMPYFESIFGKTPSSAFLKAQIKQAALTVPGVAAVSVVALKLVQRKLTGTVLVSTSSNPTPITVNF
jgi:hypothetical protein